MTKRTVLMDGDTILFAAASAAQYDTNWGEGDVYYVWTNLKDAKERVESSIERISDDVGATEVVIALSCAKETRYRKRINPEYKANRSGSRKPVGYYELVAWLEEEYETYTRPGLEGDDVLGILATHPKLYPGDNVIAAIDKDLKTIPCTLYNYDKKTFEEISPYEADRFFILQTLMGDATDGYSGCPGVGPVTAEKILNAAEEDMDVLGRSDMAVAFWPYVVETYEKKGLNEDVALLNARMARILRATDYDYKKGEPILWTPR